MDQLFIEHGIKVMEGLTVGDSSNVVVFHHCHPIFIPSLCGLRNSEMAKRQHLSQKRDLRGYQAD